MPEMASGGDDPGSDRKQRCFRADPNLTGTAALSRKSDDLLKPRQAAMPEAKPGAADSQMQRCIREQPGARTRQSVERRCVSTGIARSRCGRLNERSASAARANGQRWQPAEAHPAQAHDLRCRTSVPQRGRRDMHTLLTARYLCGWHRYRAEDFVACLRAFTPSKNPRSTAPLPKSFLLCCEKAA